MSRAFWILLPLMVCAQALGLAATKDAGQPDKEMLRLMDFLRDWEMIKDMKMMRDLQAVEREESAGPQPASQQPLPGAKKEGSK